MFKFVPVILNLIFTLTFCNAQWIQQVPVNTDILYSIDFLNSDNGVSCGRYYGQENGGKAVYTTNGGINWFRASVPDSSHIFSFVKFINGTTAIMTGASVNEVRKRNNSFKGDDEYKAMFLKSFDKGYSWINYGTLPQQYTFLVSADFLNESDGFAAAEIQDNGFVFESNILKTTDGGLTWSEQLSESVYGQIKSIQFIDENNIATGFESAGGNNYGVFLRSTNGGTSWSKQTFFNIQISDLDFINSVTGYATGGNETSGYYIFRSTDTGANWFITDTLQNTLIEGIRFFHGSGTGMIYGEKQGSTYYEPFVSRTIDFGDTWTEQNIPDSTGVLVGGTLIDRYNEYVCGGTFPAVIYHTTNGGSVGISQININIPVKYFLSQNYPNPFNPETHIKFDLSQDARREMRDVRLIVYNALGKEVQTLVNEKLSAGKYEVNFNASNLSSGIYFYRLFIDGLAVETKTMMLLK